MPAMLCRLPVRIGLTDVSATVQIPQIQLDTAAFMEEFGLPLKTRTKDGYNPLLDDFKNTKFYLSVPTHNVPTHNRK